jgi:hypothetical protein
MRREKGYGARSARFPRSTRHFMRSIVVIAVFLSSTNIDEALMSRHIMVSTIFLKNCLDRLLKPVISKLMPSFMIETRQELE